jgi:ankyrin repeat protein
MIIHNKLTFNYYKRINNALLKTKRYLPCLFLTISFNPNVETAGGKLNPSLLSRALYQAIISHDTNKLQSLIDQGVDLNIKIWMGMTALYAAIKYLNTPDPLNTIMILLLNNGADPDLETENCLSPLSYAITANVPDDIVKALIEKSDPAKWKKDIVFRALEKGLLNSAELLIKKGANIHYKDSIGFSCLHFAAKECTDDISSKIVNLLLDRGSDINATTTSSSISSKDRVTPLHIAIENNNESIVRLLVKKGALLNFPIGLNPLHIAIKNSRDSVSMVSLLIELGADINLQLSFRQHDASIGGSPLSLAIRMGNSCIASYLIKKGCDVNAKNDKGTTALFELANQRMDHLWDTMLDAGADLNIPNDSHSTVLDAIISDHILFKQSIIKKNLIFIEKLINRGAKSINTSNLLYAVKEGDVELVKLLLDKKVFPFSDLSPKEIKALKLFLLKSAELKPHKTLDLTSRLFIFGSWNKGSIEYISRAIEKEEEKILKARLVKRNYKKFNDLTSTIKTLKKTGPKDQLEEKRKKLERFNARIDEAINLHQKGDVEQAKKLLKVESRVSGKMVVCSYLIGEMCPGESLKEDVYLIIDRLINSSSLKDMLRFSRVSSLIYEVSADKKFNSFFISDDKMTFLKNVTKNGFKNLEELSLVEVFLKLENYFVLREYISCKENPLAFLKQEMRALFEKNLDLKDVQDVETKYKNTFGKFRNPAGIFIYAASLTQHRERTRVKQLLSTYVKDVLEGRFLEERYNIANSVHLKTISEIDGGHELLETWKKGKEIPLEELCEADSSTHSSKPNYLEIFKQKIVTDHHLGEDWWKKYPYLSKVLKDNENLEDVISNLNEDLKTKKEEPSEENLQEVALIEAQKKILILCQPEVSLDETLLKELIDFFVGDELRNDLQGLLTTPPPKSKKTSAYTVCDTDDPQDIILMGQEIRGSCQRLGGDAHLNCGLLGPLLDGKYRIIAVKDTGGRLVARCLLKLLWDKELKKPVLFQERLYVNGRCNGHAEALNKMCLLKAQEMNITLLNKESFSRGGTYPNAVSSIGGRSCFEYVDALGGVKTQVYDISSCTVIWEPTASL